MKPLLIIFGIALIVLPARSQNLVHRLIVQSSSRIYVEGTTNVNNYTCAISRYTGSDTLELHEGGLNVRPVFTKGVVQLDASCFDCGLALMTSDFQKTIKSSEHPTIAIDFISFERMPAYSSTPQRFKGVLKISLGGVSKVFEVNCAIDVNETGLIHLVGSRSFVFSDFKLTPPTRMLGAIKVNQALKVSFHLKLRLDPNS